MLPIMEMERAFEQRLRRVVDWRDVVQSSARRVVAVLSTFSSLLKEKKLDPRNKAFVKVMSRNSFERIFRSGPMLLLSCMLFSFPPPLPLVHTDGVCTRGGNR